MVPAQEYVDAYLEAAVVGDDRRGTVVSLYCGRPPGPAGGSGDVAGHGAPDDQAPGAVGGTAR